jgi:hypothetical protein
MNRDSCICQKQVFFPFVLTEIASISIRNSLITISSVPFTYTDKLCVYLSVKLIVFVSYFFAFLYINWYGPYCRIILGNTWYAWCTSAPARLSEVWSHFMWCPDHFTNTWAQPAGWHIFNWHNLNRIQHQRGIIIQFIFIDCDMTCYKHATAQWWELGLNIRYHQQISCLSSPPHPNFHPHHQRFYSQNLASRINETAFPDCFGAATL